MHELNVRSVDACRVDMKENGKRLAIEPDPPTHRPLTPLAEARTQKVGRTQHK